MARYHPVAVVPIIRDAFAAEWSAEQNAVSYFLYRYSQSSVAVPSEIKTALYQIITTTEPKQLQILDRGLGVARHLVANPEWRVLETAKDEDAVQNWLAEQLRLRALGRFHAPRESQVAEGNMPDILVLASSAREAHVGIDQRRERVGPFAPKLDEHLGTAAPSNPARSFRFHLQ